MIKLITVGIISFIVGYIIGRFNQRQKIKKILSKGTGRLGIIEYNYLDHKFTVEVEEIEEAGLLTKVNIIKVIKLSGESYTTSVLLEKVKFKEWIQTSMIIWYNNNSQKIRDNKINQILNSKI